MAIKSFCCVTTDFVEPDLNWEFEQYRSAGVDYFRHQLRLAPPQDLISAISSADALVVDQAVINAEVIAGLKQCKLIIRHGDGFDNLDLEAATEAGIVCVNEPGFWSREVAEQAFSCSISLALRIPVQQRVAQSPRLGADAGWNLGDIMPYRSLASLTVGIIGCGKIGSQTAEMFRPLVRKVLVYDPYKDCDCIDRTGAESASLDKLLGESDIVSIHTPVTQETVNFFDADRLNQMKQGAILVNTARGSLVDTEAVYSALMSGKLGGAALDSTVPEPLSGNHPLFSLDNVIITPHMAWYSEDALWAIRKQIVADVLGARMGGVPASVINPGVLAKENLRLKRTKYEPGENDD